MTKKDVQVGATYRIKHTSGFVDARILREITRNGYGSGRSVTHWIALNTKTNREIEIKSAAKLIRLVSNPA